MGSAVNVHLEPLAIDKSARAAMKLQQPLVLWFTGLPGSGKLTIGRAKEARLHRLGRHTMMLDGDSMRLGLNKDLGFSDADRGREHPARGRSRQADDRRWPDRHLHIHLAVRGRSPPLSRA